jgi:hypothetical protein
MGRLAIDAGVCTALPSARKTLDLGSREFDIRTPEMQSGADCFCQGEQRPNKTYRQFYRQLTFPAVTISDLQRREAPLSTCNHC